MRAMKKGDFAFFYASGGKSGRKPGIVGIMEIVSEAQPDPSTADEGTPYYVENESLRKKWCVVGVKYRSKLAKPVLLKELQKYGGSGPLGGMDLLTQTRLSVGKVTKKAWDFIVEDLIDDYEDKEDESASKAGGVVEKTDANAGATDDDEAMEDAPPIPNAVIETETVVEETVMPNGATTIETTETIVDDGLPNGATGAELLDDLAMPDVVGGAMEDTELPDASFETATGLPQLALPTVESDLMTTDAMAPNVASSRPASRAASRTSRTSRTSRQPSVARAHNAATEGPASRQPSVRPASRAGSVASRASRQPSVAPIRGGPVEKQVLSRPTSHAGSLVASVASLTGRPTSRGRSRTPKVRAVSYTHLTLPTKRIV